MSADRIPKIIEAERMERGLLILFEDGTQAMYPAQLPYQMLSVAEKMSLDEPDDEGG
jgi:hypothetical protein